jgi:hypothetical protein
MRLDVITYPEIERGEVKEYRFEVVPVPANLPMHYAIDWTTKPNHFVEISIGPAWQHVQKVLAMRILTPNPFTNEEEESRITIIQVIYTDTNIQNYLLVAGDFKRREYSY